MGTYKSNRPDVEKRIKNAAGEAGIELLAARVAEMRCSVHGSGPTKVRGEKFGDDWCVTFVPCCDVLRQQVLAIFGDRARESSDS